jgi:hypothetical protein
MLLRTLLWTLFVACILFFLGRAVRDRCIEGFNEGEVLNNDIIRIGAHMRLGMGIPLTQGEKAAMCDVAYRLPPPGGLPDASRLIGVQSATNLVLSPLPGTERLTGGGGGSIWLNAIRRRKGVLHGQAAIAKSHIGRADAAMLLDTSGTY